MSFIFSPIPQAAVPIADSDAVFPVHRIYCVGQNYAEHAKEMGATGREAPFFFMKPADAVLPVLPGTTGEMPFPGMTQNLHHEVELVVAIGKGGRHIDAASAAEHVFGYAIGLDMTRRDLQSEAKKAGRPWDTSKGFDCSAPIASIHLLQHSGWLTDAAIHLSVNGVARQKSDIANMIWNVAEVIAYLSKYYMLQPGDLIFTGTPEGVGAVQPGDVIEAKIAGLGELHVKVI
ncbi:MAG: fumarylacetoacetate hydrolase family protein [Burkholderiales bacterium]|nr:fumarylacetoacetate hydrolase family protein [Burkholderiales bacterium]